VNEAELTGVERRLWEAAWWGQELDLSVGDSSQDDPAEGAERVVRAEVVRAFSTEADWKLHAKGVQLRGAHIEGRLDLEAATLRCPLALRGCYFPQLVTVAEAEAPALRLTGSRLPSLDARQLHTNGNLDLADTHIPGEVSLQDAHIGGNLSFAGAKLANAGGRALDADRLAVDGGMFCHGEFSCEGELRLAGARIEGQLDFTEATCVGQLVLQGARIDGQLDFTKATCVGQLVLQGARIGGELSFVGARLNNAGGWALNADRLAVDGGMFCHGEFSCKGELRLPSARIDGQLDFTEATCVGQLVLQGARIGELSFAEARLANAGGWALNAVQLAVDGGMVCREGFSCKGELWLLGARIGGQLSFTEAECVGQLVLQGARIGQLLFAGARLANVGGRALNADRLAVDGGMYCHGGFSCEGELRLPGARIGGQLDFAGARLANADGPALNAEQLAVDGGMVCRKRFSCEGELRLAGARIDVQLDFTEATLANAGGRALDADRLAVDAGMFCRKGFSCKGELCLPGARIDGQLDFTEAECVGQLVLQGAHINGQLDFTKAECVGQLVLQGAHIGELSFAEARLNNADGPALNAVQLAVDGGMVCHGEFSCEGELRLAGARIGGQLDFTEATLNNAGGRALDAERLAATEALFLRFATKPAGALNLTHARVGDYYDNKATWPDRGELRLDGLTYDTIEGWDGEGEPLGVEDRCRWVDLDEDYHPRVYEQLIAVYRRAGHDADARRVGIAKQRARQAAVVEDLGQRKRWKWPIGAFLWRVWSGFLGLTVRYGYHPWLALVWLVGLWVATWLLFWVADAGAAMTQIRESGPEFAAWLYSLDVVIPLIDLGHENFWQPDPATAWGSLYQVWRAVATLLGWLLVGVGAAGVVGVLKKD
jgi:hypothetical protein